MVRLTVFLASATTLLLATGQALGAAVPNGALQSRTVYTPKITYPTNKTQWTAGKKVHVSWETDQLPSAAKAESGFIKLGHLDSNSDGEHLNQTLAKNFKLGNGNVSFTLPQDIESRDDYIVVLFGDSGNKSPKFTIHE
ncbi:hypothetical protein MYAM1_003883 [Malassezia yamatoensis]|uniref:Yeast cell wall synthesis Kre9/Knh1-like N-terminal domain-containing protein n=1 Tax=Malassezia yamatoensis TaxID=253288 RepID=A0AAJ5YYP5_9BASI|nr:hypothetical protein MYAM1_003883 [Malassezia yamatoensis]